MYALLVYIHFFCEKNQRWFHRLQFSCVYYLTSTKNSTDEGRSTNCSELDLKSDVNQKASGKLQKSTMVPVSVSDFPSLERGVL